MISSFIFRDVLVLTSDSYCIGLDKQNFQRKIVNIFLPIISTYVLGAQKNRLI